MQTVQNISHFPIVRYLNKIVRIVQTDWTDCLNWKSENVLVLKARDASASKNSSKTGEMPTLSWLLHCILIYREGFDLKWLWAEISSFVFIFILLWLESQVSRFLWRTFHSPFRNVRIQWQYSTWWSLQALWFGSARENPKGISSPDSIKRRNYILKWWTWKNPAQQRSAS